MASSFGVCAASLTGRRLASSASGNSFSSGHSSTFHLLLLVGFYQLLTLPFLLLGVGMRLRSRD